MKGTIYSIPFKAGAAILSIVSCLVCVLSIIGTSIFVSLGFYGQDNGDYYTSEACSGRVYHMAQNIVYDYYPFSEAYPQEQEILRGYQGQYGAEGSNFRFTLRGPDGAYSSISTYHGEDYGYSQTYTFTEYNEEGEAESEVQITCYLLDPLKEDDIFQTEAYWYGIGFRNRYTVLALAVFSSVMLMILSIYLISAAGHKPGSDRIVAGGLHLVPFDLLTVMAVVIGSMIVLVMYDYYDYSNMIEIAIRICTGTTLLYALVLFYVMSFAVRCKRHLLWKGTLIYRCCHKIKHTILRFYRNRSLVWKQLLWITLAVLVALFVGLISFANEMEGWFVVYMILAWMFLGGLAVAHQVHYQRIQKGIRQIAQGDLSARVNTQGLYGDMKEQAENLNHINEAVQRAVEEKLKSERMKTELITNVSHDIKTPLTSIVNYVDLLKKQEVQDETVKEYIEVLERQSIRLKKLIEDLIEASKASTGNITVDMRKLDMTELLKQISGEYTERLQEHDLELVLTAPEGEIPVLADGQLLWRVYDNLMSNALKYSQPGTRVYLDLREEQGQVMITFRNISRYALNITGEELMERFVRGDSSRHTEGSGLGLSIARSLTELMNGRFEILVDGDLFKAQITFLKLV